MNPSAIKIQSVFVALGLALVAAIGPPRAAVPLASIIALAFASLAAVGERLRRKSRVAAHRGRLAVPLTAVLVHAPWVVVWIADFHIRGVSHADRTTVLAMTLSGAAVVVFIYLSSLVDWFYVRPTLRTTEPSHMLCRSSLDHRWKFVTRIWLVHRLTAMLTFVVGIAIIVALASAHWVFHDVNQVSAAAIAAAATILAGFYLTRAAPVIAFAVTPSVQIGDKVAIADDSTQAPAAVSLYYVADVSLEGLSLLELDANDHVVRENEQRTHDRLLDIPDAARLLRSRIRFTACNASSENCKHVNPYCPLAEDELAGRR